MLVRPSLNEVQCLTSFIGETVYGTRGDAKRVVGIKQNHY